MMLKTIFEEFKIDNKFFANGFNNASNIIIVIPYLINLCNSYFGEKNFIKDVIAMF